MADKAIKGARKIQEFLLVTKLYLCVWKSCVEFEVGACRVFQFCDIADLPARPAPLPFRLFRLFRHRGIGASFEK